MAKINRPKDPNQLAKLIVEIATGEKENDKKEVEKEIKKRKKKSS